MALIAALGYKSAETADEARAAGAMHNWTGLRATLTGAKLEEIWRTGVWHDAETGEGGDDSSLARQDRVQLGGGVLYMN
jgi:hypothetical protein